MKGVPSRFPLPVTTDGTGGTSQNMTNFTIHFWTYEINKMGSAKSGARAENQR